jgi:hypothetical protein
MVKYSVVVSHLSPQAAILLKVERTKGRQQLLQNHQQKTKLISGRCRRPCILIVPKYLFLIVALSLYIYVKSP